MCEVNIKYNLNVLPLNRFNYHLKGTDELQLEQIEYRKALYKSMVIEDGIDVADIDKGRALLTSFLNVNGEISKYHMDSTETIDFAKRLTVLKHDVIVPPNITKLLEQDGNNTLFEKVLSCKLRYIEQDTIQLEIESNLVHALLANASDIQEVLVSVMGIVELYDNLFQKGLAEGEIASAYISKKMLDMDDSYEPLAYAWKFCDEINSLYTDTKVTEIYKERTVGKFKGTLNLTHSKLLLMLMNTADRLGKVLHNYERRLKENELEVNEAFLIRVKYREEKGFSLLSSEYPITATLSNYLVDISYLFEAYMKKHGYNTLTYRVKYSPCKIKILGHYVSKESVPKKQQ